MLVYHAGNHESTPYEQTTKTEPDKTASWYKNLRRAFQQTIAVVAGALMRYSFVYTIYIRYRIVNTFCKNFYMIAGKRSRHKHGDTTERRNVAARKLYTSYFWVLL